MYRPAAYVVDDPELLRDVIRGRRFATLVAMLGGELHFAYAPVIVNDEPSPLGLVRFHLARANPMSSLNGARVHFSFIAADGYVSPDWYKTRGFVPTWNYIAVEAEGTAEESDEGELHQLLIELSAAAEETLRPKPPWTIDKIPEERWRALLNGIRGFSVTLDKLEGKFKLSQDKALTDSAAVITALEARGDAPSLAIARAMRETRNHGR